MSAVLSSSSVKVVQQDQDVPAENNEMAATAAATVEKSKSKTIVPIYKARRFYPGDIVIKKIIPKNWEWAPCFGTVMKPASGSEMASTADIGSSTDFHVHWETTNRVEHTKEWNVNLADRLLLRNMRVENDEGMVGTVSNVKVLTTVQIIGTTHVVDRVSLERLRPITALIRGQEILYKDWVGVITCVRRNIWFLLDGGMGFHVNASETDGFMRNDPYWGVGVACPGIRTKLSPSVMKTATWTSGPMKFFSRWIPPLSYLYSMAHCTINKSEVTEIEVKWLQMAPEKEDLTAIPPPSKLSRDDLREVTVIGTPSSETVGINSVRMLKVRPEDSLTTYGYWLDAFKKKFIDEDETAAPPRSPAINNASLRVLVIKDQIHTNDLEAQATERVYEVPVKVLHRQSIVDVTWSNGSIQRVHSIKLPRIIPTKDDNEFPQGMVVSPLYNPLNETTDIYGVVLESDALAKSRKRKVNVQWISKGGIIETTQESVFNITPHKTYSLYQRGTIVFPRNPGATKFQSGVVSDLNIAAGKMVVTITSDNSQHEVYPHSVAPLPKRCFWNFFTRKWVLDELIPPPYQLDCEFHPSKKFASTYETSLDVLSKNNNPDGSVVNRACLWDEPSFELLGFAPETHRYFKANPGGFGKNFISAVEKEIVEMKGPYAIPEGIWIRCYENRLDLVSVLMVGPSKTPFEDGVFMFDLQLTSDFPSSPPKVHYVSYSYEISPVMSWDGNFCISSLDWSFQDAKPVSYIVNFLSQIQEMVFSSEPYFSDTRKIGERNTSRGKEIARMYNELVLIRVIDSAWNMINRPHDPWTELIKAHFSAILPQKLDVMESWVSNQENSLPTKDDSIKGTEEETEKSSKPTYPLAPFSDGFRESLLFRVEKFKKITRSFLPSEKSALSSSRTENITDETADSESVIDSGRQRDIDMTVELVDPSSAVNANEVEKTSDLVRPDSGKLDDSPTPTSLDFQKNIIRVKGRGKKSGRKGKVLVSKTFTSPSSTTGESEQSEQELSDNADKKEQSTLQEVKEEVATE